MWRFFITLAASIAESVMWWPGVRPSVCLSCRHTQRDSLGGSMRRNQRTFRPVDKEDFSATVTWELILILCGLYHCKNSLHFQSAIFRKLLKRVKYVFAFYGGQCNHHDSARRDLLMCRLRCEIAGDISFHARTYRCRVNDDEAFDVDVTTNWLLRLSGNNKSTLVTWLGERETQMDCMIAPVWGIYLMFFQASFYTSLFQSHNCT